MQWDAASGATGYNLHAGLVSGAYTVAADVGNVLTGTITVPAYGSWYVAVAPYNGAPTNEGGYSQESLMVVVAETISLWVS
jgi:hypothetical protein